MLVSRSVNFGGSVFKHQVVGDLHVQQVMRRTTCLASMMAFHRGTCGDMWGRELCSTTTTTGSARGSLGCQRIDGCSGATLDQSSVAAVRHPVVPQTMTGERERKKGRLV